MMEVTPASISYSFMMACMRLSCCIYLIVNIQFWYNISAINDWRTDDNLTDRLEFYNMILGLFEEREDDDQSAIQWRSDTLDWWNWCT